MLKPPFLSHQAGKCPANWGFCPQARNSRSKAELLSRVSWPAFSTPSVLRGIKNSVDSGKVRHVCIQALNYPDVFSHLVALVKAIKRRGNVPVSVSCQPLNSGNIRRLAGAGGGR